MHEDCKSLCYHSMPAGAEAKHRCGHAGPGGPRPSWRRRRAPTHLPSPAVCAQPVRKDQASTLTAPGFSGGQRTCGRAGPQRSRAEALYACPGDRSCSADAKAITAAPVAVLPLCGLTIADPSSDACGLNLARNKLPQVSLGRFQCSNKLPSLTRTWRPDSPRSGPSKLSRCGDGNCPACGAQAAAAGPLATCPQTACSPVAVKKVLMLKNITPWLCLLRDQSVCTCGACTSCL